MLPPGNLPTPQPKPFFDLLDRALSDEIRAHVVKRPFWIDTVGQSRHVEIRVKLDQAILRFVAPRGQTYASNSHIFLIWMVGTSRRAADRGDPVPAQPDPARSCGSPRPPTPSARGARCRTTSGRAARARCGRRRQAFLEMRDRIRHHVEQRTTMLAGVSHDLRTVLTRFKLELALLRRRARNRRRSRSDVNEMQHMLEDYLAFAKGDGGEEAAPTNVGELLGEVQEETEHIGHADRGAACASREQDAGAAAEAAGLQARDHQPRHQRRPLRRPRRHPGGRGRGMAAHRGRRRRPGHSARPSATTCSVRSTGSTTPATRTRAIPAWAWQSPAISPRSHGGDIALGDSSMGGLRATMRVPL